MRWNVQIIKNLPIVLAGGSTAKHTLGHIHNVLDFFIFVIDKTGDIRNNDFVGTRKGPPLSYFSLELLAILSARFTHNVRGDSSHFVDCQECVEVISPVGILCWIQRICISILGHIKIIRLTGMGERRRVKDVRENNMMRWRKDPRGFEITNNKQTMGGTTNERIDDDHFNILLSLFRPIG